jgi:hypothetical protein
MRIQRRFFFQNRHHSRQFDRIEDTSFELEITEIGYYKSDLR